MPSPDAALRWEAATPKTAVFLAACLIHSQAALTLQGVAHAAPVRAFASTPASVSVQVAAPHALFFPIAAPSLGAAVVPSLAPGLPSLAIPALGAVPGVSVEASPAAASRAAPPSAAAAAAPSAAAAAAFVKSASPLRGGASAREAESRPAPDAKTTLGALNERIKKSSPPRALSLFFDGGSRRDDGLVSANAADAAGLSAAGLSARPAAELSRLRELKQVLGDGTHTPEGWISHFGFRNPDGSTRMSYTAGLEGFLFTKLEQERAHGEAHALGQLADYFSYLDALLAPMEWTRAARRDLRSLRHLAIDPAAKNARLNEMLRALAQGWRAELLKIAPASWGRDAAMYMILARAYNRMKPGKNFFDSIDDAELERIASETGANTLWILDMFEIGEIRRWGTGGGSPYAIKGYHVKEELGGDAALKRLVDRAHKKGLRVVTDYIPNHTSLDSAMINERPEGFVHLLPPQPAPGETFEVYRDRIMADAPRAPWGESMYYLVKTPAYPENGKRVEKYILVHHPYQGGGYPILWVDMAQIDYSRVEAREYRLNEAKELFRRTGIDGVRRDMAYFVLNERFFRHWLGTLKWERDLARGWVREQLAKTVSEMEGRREKAGKREYLDELMEAVRSVNPAAFHFDEAYEEFDALSRTGSYARYNKTGLFDALGERNAAWVRGALKEVAFRKWQTAASGLVNFPISHDADDTHGGRGYAVDRYGPVLEAVLTLTLGLRPSLIYNGIEQGMSQRELLISDQFGRSKDLNKPIPFDIPVKIDWSKQNPARKAFFKTLAAFTNKWKTLLTDGVMDVLDAYGETPLAAYTAAKGDGPAVLVAANLAEHEAWGHFRMDGAAAKLLGAFEPKEGKSYRFTDRAAGGKSYAYSGARLIAEGIYFKLGAGKVHLFEIEEFDTPPGESAAASARTFRQPSAANEADAAINAADALAVRLSIEAAEAQRPQPRRETFWRASWDTWTKRLTNSAFLAFLPLQVPQIVANFGFIFAGTLNPISILPWMGYSTGILANMILLSYFVSKKEKGAALVQAVGVLSSALVVGQIFYAGFMPAAAFWAVAAAILAGLGLNALHYRGVVNAKLWEGWKEFVGMAGLATLPLVFSATFLAKVAYWPAALAFGLGGLYLALRKAGRLPKKFEGLWMKASAWTATLLFMFGPLAQISANLADPANMAGLSLLTLLLATLGNGMMIPRAVHTKDWIWFSGSAWAVSLGGIGVMATMFAYGFLSPLFFFTSAAVIAAVLGGSFLASHRAGKAEK